MRAATIGYGAGEHPISLAELCDIFRDCSVTLRCELKPGPGGVANSGFAPKVVAELTRCGMLHRTRFSSFLFATVDALQAAANRPCPWLVSPPVLTQLGAAEALSLADRIAVMKDGHLQQVDTPGAIYDRPANRFAGAPTMNFRPPKRWRAGPACARWTWACAPRPCACTGRDRRCLPSRRGWRWSR